MARKFLTAIDLGTNELQNAVIQNLAAASEPTGVKGRVYFDSTNNIIKFYDGTAWKALATGGDLSGYQPLDADLTAISSISGTGLLKRTGSDTWTTITDSSSNWDTAYGWGNHASAGYATLTGVETITNKTFDGITYISGGQSYESNFGKAEFAYYPEGTTGLWIASVEGSTGGGYISFAADKDIDVYAQDNIYLRTNNADIILNPDGQAYIGGVAVGNEIATRGWVNAQDYAGITTSDISNWNTAYGWGDHGAAGYLTVAVESLSNTDSNLSISSSTGSVTIDFANNIAVNDSITVGGIAVGEVNGSLEVLDSGSQQLLFVDHESAFIGVSTTMNSDLDVEGNLTVQGDLTVNGTTTTLNTQTVAVEDNVILLNSNIIETPTNAGIEVNRGTENTNASILWNEMSGVWQAGLLGSEATILLSGIATSSDINGFSTDVTSVIDGHLSGSNSISVSSGAIDTTLATTSYLSKSSGLAVDISSLETKLVTDNFTKKYAANNSAITVSGGVASWTVTHGLSSRDVTVQVYTVSGYEAVEVDVERTSTSTVTLTWNAASNISADTYRVVIVG